MFSFDEDALNTPLYHSDNITIDDSGDSEELGAIANSPTSNPQSIISFPKNSNEKQLSYEERLKEFF